MFNYTKKDLNLIASETGFIRDNLEKIIRLSDILRYINENSLFTDNLALKGGTAINLIIFSLPRLSVDIDFDFTWNCERNEMLRIRKKINTDLLNYMFSEGYALSPHTKNPHTLDSWAFYFQNSVGNRDVIKVEINYSNRNHILPLTKKKINLSFISSSEYEIITLSELELFGSKINALINRTAPRDIYDVNNMILNNIVGNDKQDLLRKIVVFYLALGGKNKAETEMKFNKIDTLKYQHFRDNLIPLLRKTEHFDFESAKTAVLNYLHDLMKLTDGEKLFIENFNSGIYSPKLLFDDYQIVKRIENHPMALWKIEQINCTQSKKILPLQS
jgi:predicted nucleotidyltransferase component of viral defense system